MTTTWVYIQSEPSLWTVGFYSPDGRWQPDSDHSSREEAAERVHYLNGGHIQKQEPEGMYAEYLHRYFPEKYEQKFGNEY